MVRSVETEELVAIVVTPAHFFPDDPEVRHRAYESFLTTLIDEQRIPASQVMFSRELPDLLDGDGRIIFDAEKMGGKIYEFTMEVVKNG